MFTSDTVKFIFQDYKDFTYSDLHVFFITESLEISEICKKFKCNENISKVFHTKNFKGKLGELCEVTIYDDKNNFYNFLFVGIGKQISEISDAKIIGEKIANCIDTIKISKACIYLLESDFPINCIKMLISSLYNSEYRFTKYFIEKKDQHKRLCQEITIATDIFPKYESTLTELIVELEAKSITRDLVIEPSNVLFPEKFVDYCRELTILGVEVRILNEDEMRKEGMNALLAVAQGSSHKPYSVYMKWNGDKSQSFEDSLLAIVGKGVTFDSGGINIKSSPTNMKCDMAGAATVFGTIYALAKNKIKKNIVAAVGLVENMPSGTSFKPDDVIISMEGKSIEIDNTDAEGRLVLADVLCYVQKYYKPKKIIDLATLTGAISICLGSQHAGLFCNNDQLANSLIESGKNTLDLLWRLPLTDYYDKLNDSHIADIKNCAREAGSVTAAQFLKRFILPDVQWAHIDIAGVAYRDKYTQSTSTQRATGFGVALLLDFIKEK